MTIGLATKGYVQKSSPIAIPITPTGLSWEDLENAIRSHYKTNVVDLILGGLPTQYDNDDFADKPTDDSRWARLTIVESDDLQVTFGDTKRVRTPGVMVVSIFVPLGAGNRAALVVADVIRNAFLFPTVSGVTFQAPSIQKIGKTKGKEWQTNVSCPFYSDIIS